MILVQWEACNVYFTIDSAQNEMGYLRFMNLSWIRSIIFPKVKLNRMSLVYEHE